MWWPFMDHKITPIPNRLGGECAADLPGPQKRGTGGTLIVVAMGRVVGTGATRHGERSLDLEQPEEFHGRPPTTLIRSDGQT